MSQISAINQELLRQINDSVGYKLKLKVDSLVTQSNINTANITYIAGQIPGINTYLSNLTGAVTTIDGTVNTINGTVNTIDTRTQNIDSNVIAILTQMGTDTSNVNYLVEVTAINDTSLASTVGKSLTFHKFLTTEHIPTSNLFANLANLEQSNDTYVTGLGAVGVKKNGLDVFEEYYNGNYPGSMFGTFSCGKELMGMMFGRMMKLGVGLHNAGTEERASNLLTLDTTVSNIIYGTDIKAYGATGITLPRGLENARMRDLLSMKAGFHEFDALLWFMYWENVLTSNGGSAYWSVGVTPLLYGYALWAGIITGGAVVIATFANVQNCLGGNAGVNLRNFCYAIKSDLVDNVYGGALAGLDLFVGYSFYNILTSNNVIGDEFIGTGYSNTSVRYQRSGYEDLYGQNKFEHYNNECTVFATKMMQLALMKEARYGNGNVLSLTRYSNVSLADIGAKTFGGSYDATYVSRNRENMKTFFKYEMLRPAGISLNTNLSILQSDNYGTIMNDYIRMAFPHLMTICDKFSEDLFKVRDSNVAVTSLYSNLFLSNITEYNFTSSNIIPRTQVFQVDPFDTPAVIKSGELTNSQKFLNFTNGIWSYTDVLANNKVRSSNVYMLTGLYGQRFVMGRDATAAKNRYTVGMMSDDLVNNPLNVQGSEFLQTNKDRVNFNYVESEALGKGTILDDATSYLLGKYYPDSLTVPIFAYGVGAITGFRTRQEVDKCIALVQDVKVSSNTWGYDTVGGPTLRMNADRVYYSNLTTANAIKVASVTTGVLAAFSNCVADGHLAQMDIFDRAKLTF
jgi:hypothetical protein